MTDSTATPSTAAPSTVAPCSSVPATSAPATSAPATSAPATSSPATSAPATSAPATSAPDTSAPATSAPDTAVPATSAPATSVPATSVPATSVPATSAQDTAVPATSVPATSAPSTPAPATSAPATSAPATSVPATSAPDTAVPATLAPATAVPSAETPAAVVISKSTPITAAPSTSAPSASAASASGAFTSAASTSRAFTSEASTSGVSTLAASIAVPIPPPPNDRNEESPPPICGEVSRGARRRDPPSKWMEHKRNDTSGGRGSRHSAIRRTQKQRFGNRMLIPVPSQHVCHIIGNGGLNILKIQNETGVIVSFEDSSGPYTNVILIGIEEALKKAEIMISDLIQQATTNRHNTQYTGNDIQIAAEFFKYINGKKFIDWPKISEYYYAYHRDKYATLPRIVKDFYEEDPVVTAMTPGEVTNWRRTHDDINVRRSLSSRSDSPSIPNPVLTFEQAFRNFPEVLNEIYNQGLTAPTPIQSQSWPILLRGDDLIAISQPSTARTLAFLLPAFIHVDGQITPRHEREGPAVLILAPTRELVLQIYREATKYQYKGMKSLCLYGGTSNTETASRDVDIVIATPGRFSNLIMARVLDVMNFTYIVLDEADKIIDMGFEPFIRKSLFNVRPDRQSVITSATWTPEVRSLAQSFMRDPIRLTVGSLDLSKLHAITQKVVFVKEDDKTPVLMSFVCNINPNAKIMIFCGRNSTASHILQTLDLYGLQGVILYAERDQSELQAMINSETNRILVVTEMILADVDLTSVTHVINYDFPRNIEDYIQRVGITSCNERTAIVVTFLTRDNWGFSRDIILILHESAQEVPDELEEMARRFEAMQLRSIEGRDSGRHRRRDNYDSGNED